MTDKKTYLGDGVYADTDGHHIILTAGEGSILKLGGPDVAQNEILIEPQVFEALIRYVERLKNGD